MKLQLVFALAAIAGAGTDSAWAIDPPTLIQITHNAEPYDDSIPFGMSDDGHTIAWTRSPSSDWGPWQVFVGDEDGANQREVATIGCFSRSGYDCGGITMSGDGRTIAYGSCDDPLGTNPNGVYGVCQIFLVNSDGTNLRQLTTLQWGEASDPALNTDGSVVAYTWKDSSWPSVVAQHTGDTDAVIVDEPQRAGETRFNPEIDSAGERVALQGRNRFGFQFRYGGSAARADGSERHDITPFITNSTLTDGIHISRDGGTVLYTASADFTGQNPGGADPYDPAVQAFIIPWEGGLIRQITDGGQVHSAYAARQPMIADGSRAALHLVINGGEECSVVWIDTNTGATEDIFPRSAATCGDLWPMVSADGRVLLFASSRVTSDNPGGWFQVFVLRYGPPPQTGSAPTAAAGPDQTLECEGSLQATALLDGSASTDPDSSPGTSDDIVDYSWSEGGTSVGNGAQVSVSFPLGPHDITLTVTDRSGATAIDATLVDVVDSLAPTGAIVAPAPGSCHGPASLPVNVIDNFADVCDPALLKTFDPAPGPFYSTHGDYHVSLTARDGSGNTAASTVNFTIDTVPPAVAILAPTGSGLNLPTSLPVSVIFQTGDDDGAAGDVVHETIALQGCVIYDGATYGNRDGLLHDETIALTQMELCRIAAACGFTQLDSPELRVDATDCGGNVGTASVTLHGRIAISPWNCGLGIVPRGKQPVRSGTKLPLSL